METNNEQAGQQDDCGPGGPLRERQANGTGEMETPTRVEIYRKGKLATRRGR